MCNIIGCTAQPSAGILSSFLFRIRLKLFPGMTADGNNHHVETTFVIHITRKLVFLWFVDSWLCAGSGQSSTRVMGIILSRWCVCLFSSVQYKPWM